MNEAQTLPVVSDGLCREEWSIASPTARPLSEALVAYAAADVVHLHAMWTAWRHFMGQGNMDKTVTKRMNNVIKAHRHGEEGRKEKGARRDF